MTGNLLESNIDVEISYTLNIEPTEPIIAGRGSPVSDSDISHVDELDTPLTRPLTSGTFNYPSSSPQRTSTPFEFLFSTPRTLDFESNAILSEYLRDKWNQQGPSVVERLESYLTPIRDETRATSSNSNNPELIKELHHIEISSGQFINY